MEPLERLAPVQVSESRLKELVTERHASRQQELGGSAVFNVWHRKWAGGDQVAAKYKSAFRCNAARDSGKTKSRGPFFCLWFARGCCYKGANCQYLHRVPSAEDAIRLSALNTTDCFGRSKFASARDDMSGVGSFMHPCRTLHLGYFNRKDPELISKIKEQFSEWGTVTSVRADRNQTMAFVTYSSLSNAEFAKEAMSNQTLSGHETLTVRWARDSKQGDSDLDLKRLRNVVRVALEKRKRSLMRDNEQSGFKGSNDVEAKVSVSAEDLSGRQDQANNSSEPQQAHNASAVLNAPPPRKRRALVSYE